MVWPQLPDNKDRRLRSVTYASLCLVRTTWCDDSGFRRVALSVHANPREASTQQAGQLSQARAEYISRLVVSLGVPASNICMRAQGARQPVAEPPSPKNIRVEMVVSCLNPQRPFCE
ncbi:OmpA family protein [Acidovorax sp.]|uniref:OmpA family protein n=1 Tax=Acidovorax sp. TaxID=1872122 RepID=UPI00345A7A9D